MDADGRSVKELVGLERARPRRAEQRFRRATAYDEAFADRTLQDLTTRTKPAALVASAPA
jgi:hypothetical protein